MAQVRRRWIDNYANALESLSDKAKAGLSAELAALDWDRPVADVREELVPIMQAWCGVSAETASLLGAEFYQGLRNDTPLRTRYVAEPAGSGYSDDRIEGAVRAIVQPLAERGQEGVSQVVSGLLERLGYEVKSAAGETVFENGRRDPERVRYARVPRGSKSYPSGCPFCQMLASRGFKYLSELTAGGDDPSHYHDSCQCMVVPGFGEDPRAEGYNPHDYDWGYQEWLNRGLPMMEACEAPEFQETFSRLKGPVGFLRGFLAGVEGQALQARPSAKRTSVGEWVRNALSHVVDLGPRIGMKASDYLELSNLSSPLARAVVERAVQYVPVSWLEAIAKLGVTLYEAGVERPFYEDGNISFDPARHTEFDILHELMHAAEIAIPALFSSERDYFERRTAGHSLVLLRTLTGDGRFGPDERAYDMGGRCIDPYAFKDYSDGAGGYDGFELLSVGIECLYSRPEAFVNDPSMLAFVLGMMSRVR